MNKTIHSLSPLQRELVTERLGENPSAFNCFPLSYTQVRLWFLSQIDPSSAVYNVPIGVYITGPLDLEALRWTFDQLVNRHEILRTTFITVNGQPMQMVGLPTKVAIEQFGFESNQPSAVDVEAAVENSARQPFDLTQGPLFRIGLGRLGRSRHMLVVTMHHIIADAWSMGILVREFGILYMDFQAARSSSLPPLILQYVDYAVWQREWLQGAVLERQLVFWKDKIGDTAPALELPQDKQRPALQTFRGARVPLFIAPPHSEGLMRLASAEGATLFNILLAIFHALLFRYSGAEKIFVGCPVANRNRTEIEDVIGPFVNTLVIRAGITGDMSIRTLLQQVRDTSLAALSHQDMPFEKLVEIIRPERDLSVNPVFRVSFQLQNVPLAPVKLPGLMLEPVMVDLHACKFDLSLDLWEGTHGIWGWLEYSTDIFGQPTIERMANHFYSLASGVVENPDLPVARLSMLTELEKAQLIGWSSGTDCKLGRSSVHELIAAVAARTPNTIAISCGNSRLSFKELSDRAEGLAARLRSAGVRNHSRVGILMRRSVELPVAILATWSAGGAYVALDPAHPADRNSFIFEDAGVSVVVTDSDIELAFAREVQIVRADISVDNAVKASWADSENNAVGLAYLVYTSGTTGTPKGVMVEHVQLVNTLLGNSRDFGFTADDVFVCVSAVTFDIFLFELLSPLLVGGRVEIISNPLDISAIADAVPSVIHAVPSLMRQIVAFAMANHDHRFRHQVRSLFVGGDAVAPELLHGMAAAFPSASRRVLYGPTEATIICASHVDAGESRPHNMIGKPLRNVVLRVCDSYGNDVPPGVAGEIWIGGDSVARGYWGLPGLTAERYVQVGKLRFYRSGDLARYLPDGSLAFLGRLDDQVKIRGFRIELGEVESALCQHSGVQIAAAVVSTHTSGEKELRAYVVPRPGMVLVEAELKSLLRKFLAEYMVPSHIGIVENIPLTAHGKIDRAQLAAIRRPASLAQSTLAPRNDLECKIALAWECVLKTPAAGIDDNFFDAGGNSLLLLAVQAELKSSLGFMVSIVDLFRHPTVRSLASHLDGKKESKGEIASEIAIRAQRHVHALGRYKRLQEKPQ
jgi:amino acid adenylation domain-containing protein